MTLEHTHTRTHTHIPPPLLSPDPKKKEKEIISLPSLCPSDSEGVCEHYLTMTCLVDSPVPPLNPYFILRDGWCSGVWSDAIVAELNRTRPDAQFEDLAESFGEVGINKDGRMVISPEFPRSRVLSLKLSNYAYLAGGIAVP